MRLSKISIVLFTGLNLPILFFFFLGCGPDCSPFLFETRNLLVLKAQKLTETSLEIKYEYLHGESSEIRYDSLIFDVYVQQKELFAGSGVPGLLFACTPDLNFQDQLSNINIYSDQDYNEDYPKGSNLNSLFQYRLNTDLPSYDLPEFIDLINQQGLGRDHFLIYLTTPPAQKLSHQIDFEIELTNGEKFHAVIENLTIEK